MNQMFKWVKGSGLLWGSILCCSGCYPVYAASTRVFQEEIETTLCGRSIRELARSAKAGDFDLLRVFFGILRSETGTTEERREVFDSLLNIARTGDKDAARICVSICRKRLDYYVDAWDKMGEAFIQLANEGKPEALLFTTRLSTVIDRPEVQRSLIALMSNLVVQEIPANNNCVQFALQQVSPEEQMNFIRLLVKLAKEGNMTALEVLHGTSRTEGTGGAFLAFLQKLRRNGCAAALKFEPDLTKQIAYTAKEWLTEIRRSSRPMFFCDVKHLVESA
ncbi:MAG: hypothetical protein LBQ43_02670, partial [Holosporales bacterium]|nr:hypothetical protein [Holosporales bacterium]